MLALRADQIGTIMGLEPLPKTFAELDATVANGIRKAALRAIVGQLVERREQILPLLYRIVPEGTFKRRKGRLSPEESERTERLARVFATAAYVLESNEDARRFLHAPHPMLEGRAPLDVAFTEIGAQRVERILWAVHHGLAA
ncbi:MAG TPA: antitoxin Xre/MbcA/ParS toxin-binding domain-containing protein [Burkholderiaceae bacterium]|nr:antitoxin Xre/MbcA/ParS toxin-binding domain-containing protein [Burkholderiaceae bacterium]